MLKPVDQLWPGDHLRVNGQDMLFDDWVEPWEISGQHYDGFVRGFVDTGSVMVMHQRIETIELVARPEVRFTDRPVRGDWVWQWYTCAEPGASIFWELVGPWKDGTYTLRTVNRYDLERHVKADRFNVRPGWINGLTWVDGQFIDEYGAPVPFFTPPFVPECLQLGARASRFQPRLF